MKKVKRWKRLLALVGAHEAGAELMARASEGIEELEEASADERIAVGDGGDREAALGRAMGGSGTQRDREASRDPGERPDDSGPNERFVHATTSLAARLERA